MNKTMKTVAASLIAAVLVIPGFASAADKMEMAKVDYSKFKVVQKNGESWVPLRQISESLGYNVQWSKLNGIMLSKKIMSDMTEMMDTEDMMDKDMMDKNMMDTKIYAITLKIGQKDFMIGMEKMMVMKAPMLMKNTTYVTKDFIETYLLNPMLSK